MPRSYGYRAKMHSKVMQLSRKRGTDDVNSSRRSQCTPLNFEVMSHLIGGKVLVIDGNLAVRPGLAEPEQERPHPVFKQVKHSNLRSLLAEEPRQLRCVESAHCALP
jgi:hypothetical protein